MNLKPDYTKIITVKQAAMFGLDARIALAIFGALSVISGAALYSAIKTAKTEQLRQYFVEMNKASEQYYLDNGQELPPYKTNAHQLTYIPDLVSNRESLSTWKGPYIDGVGNTDNTMKSSFTSRINTNVSVRIVLRNSSTWSEANDFTSDGLCAVGNTDCSEWIMLHSGGETALFLTMFDDLDLLVDNGDGELAGKVRYNTAYEDYIMYQGRPRKRVF